MADKKDVVIIGSGPAGLSAAVYAKRAMLDAVVIEKEFSGGQIVTTLDYMEKMALVLQPNSKSMPMHWV